MTPIPMSGLPDLGGPSFDDLPGESVSISHLSGIQKAAIMVQAMAQQGAEISLEALPEEAQARLIHEIGNLGEVDTATVDAVKREFFDRLRSAGLTGPSGMKRALDLLGNALSASVAAKLRAQTTSNTIMGDPWKRIVEKEAEELIDVLESESVEVAAVILSKLKVARAAELLGMMPGDRARKITYAISLTSPVTPSAVARIGRALAAMLAIQPTRAFDDGPVERVGAILNFSRAATRNQVLDGLDETDKDFAEEVRRAIFTFANIPERVDARDVPKIVRQVEQPVLVRALGAALMSEMKPAGEFLLAGLSQRMADSLRGEIEDQGPVDEESGEEAMGIVVTAIRELEANGEIYLIVDEG